MKGVTVEIMGQNLVVASDSGDDWARTLAAAVDEKMRDMRASSKAASSISLAILVALNFADELERLRHEHKTLLDEIEALNRRLSAVI